MATKRSQRIGIWVIAVVMLIGTLGSFFVVVIANDNAAKDQVAQQSQQEKYLEQMKQAAAKNAEASKPLDGYTAEPFDAASVTELKVDTLVHGEGKVAEASSTVTANYFGWTADGKIFDSTNKNGTVTPIDFNLKGVIEGWTKGLTGVAAGSTVKLTIPTVEAYGADAAKSGMPAGPLTFIVELKDVK